MGQEKIVAYEQTFVPSMLKSQYINFVIESSQMYMNELFRDLSNQI